MENYLCSFTQYLLFKLKESNISNLEIYIKYENVHFSTFTLKIL